MAIEVKSRFHAACNFSCATGAFEFVNGPTQRGFTSPSKLGVGSFEFVLDQELAEENALTAIVYTVGGFSRITYSIEHVSPGTKRIHFQEAGLPADPGSCAFMLLSYAEGS